MLMVGHDDDDDDDDRMEVMRGLHHITGSSSISAAIVSV